MTKITYKIVLVIFLVVLILLAYLSIVGVKTTRLNSLIIEKTKNFDENLDIELQKVHIKLDLFNLNAKIKTVGTNLRYNNKFIELANIKSDISLKSLINKNFLITNIKISTKNIKIKDVISFTRLFKNEAKLYIIEKLVKKGFLIADLDIKFDKEGKIKDNYSIKGIITNGKINFSKNYDLSKIFFNFEIKKDYFNFKDIKLSLNDNDISIPQLITEKKKELYLISGKVNNKKINLSQKNINNFINIDNSILDIKTIEFASENSFSFEIGKDFIIKNLKINSNINLKNFSFLSDNEIFFEILPKFKKNIKFQNHQINFKYDNNDYNIDGLGNFLIQDVDDKVKYKISKIKKKINFDLKFEIIKNQFNLDFLNYEKKNESRIEILVNGEKISNKNFLIKKISLKDSINQIKVNDLVLIDNKINSFKSIDLNYLDKENLKNKYQIFRNNEYYILKGENLNLNKFIEETLNSKSKKKRNMFKNNFKLEINVKEAYLDKKNIAKNLEGNLFYENNKITDANLVSNFSSQEKVQLTIRKAGNQTVTTFYSDRAKPFVKRYKFIKGFEEGSLDYYSVKTDKITNSKLKIYDFKLKKLPVLTKVLTLASLQGIADLLSGEGIRFNEFEMNFANRDNLMTIEEIYSIGPSISVLMEGYVEKDKLISLRGTLVPATTLNKTIGAIPFLGDILVGNNVGEGVFGVSFKIKGPPKKLETTVNPIKTLTPRFITRTLEKIKKN